MLSAYLILTEVQVFLELLSSPKQLVARPESKLKFRVLPQASMASISTNLVRKFFLTKFMHLLTQTLGNLIEGCKTAGPHFNPNGVVHGGPDTEVRHVGDLGNILAGDDGLGHLDYEDRLVELTGKDSVIGRSCVCHGK